MFIVWENVRFMLTCVVNKANITTYNCDTGELLPCEGFLLWHWSGLSSSDNALSPRILDPEYGRDLDHDYDHDIDHEYNCGHNPVQRTVFMALSMAVS